MVMVIGVYMTIKTYNHAGLVRGLENLFKVVKPKDLTLEYQKDFGDISPEETQRKSVESKTKAMDRLNATRLLVIYIDMTEQQLRVNIQLTSS